MIISAFLFSCMVAGSLACSNENCKYKELSKELSEVSYFPNGEELKTLCPEIKAFLECQKEFLECPGQSLEELTTSSDEIEKMRSKALIAAIGMVRDVCDESTSIHTDYVDSAICLREFFAGKVYECGAPGVETPADKFIGSIYTEASGDEMDDKRYSAARCVRAAYELTCVIDSLDETCGSVAKRLAIIAFQRLKVLMGPEFCSDIENSAIILSQFLDYLELDEQRKTSTQELYDLFLSKP